MRIVTRRELERFGRRYADARGALDTWLRRTRAAEWANLAETRRTFPHADEVRVGSGRPVTVFNIRGNHYRLITAIHYNTGTVFVMRFFTHAEYDRDDWKDTL
jgi:mRNA interferase HigB